MHMKSSRVIMKDVGLRPYLNTFLPGWEDVSTESQNLAANIEIGEQDVWLERGVELLPFIRLLCREPKVNITTSSTPIGEEIQELLNRREEWAKVLDGTVEEMNFVVIRKELKDQGLEFQILFKNEFSAPWVRYGDEGGEILDRDYALEFVRELRIEADDGFISVWLCLQSDAGGGGYLTSWRILEG
jgi:hypothetical protein